ncbi:hypothetical protein [Actinomycetospora termitidis]|uniref:Uncharacterized protein n=1 Tax=Actinomycetospora termitidis TaxID=3053470 RepID=A0ABT7M8Y1_9PSEU|nr:hypothetical protein [Actinomycetospora sp. Odt1-22]MDL5156492.1 hypothetical protein [Actinomycetospora sp. Odt1-22]
MTQRLSRGAHSAAEEGTCLMEQVALAADESFSDRPRCTPTALSALAQQVNDRVSDAGRDRLLELVPALTTSASDDPVDAWELVAVCARAALAIRPDDRLATRLLARAGRAQRRWSRLGLDGAPGRIAGLRALPHLTAAFHRMAVLAGPAGSAERDDRLIALLADAVGVRPEEQEFAAA